MRTPISPLERTTGAFLLVTFALAAVALALSARRTSLADMFREGFVVTAVGDDAFGATVGSPVKVRDVEVGSVTSVDLVDEASQPGKPVRIRMRLAPNTAAFLKDGTVAHILRPPFGSDMPPFGTSSVELESRGSLPLARRSLIPAVGEESMVGTFAKMAGDVATVRQQLGPVLLDLSAALGSVRTLTDGLTSGRGVAGHMFSDEGTSEMVMSTLREAHGATKDLRRIASDLRSAAALAPQLAEGVKKNSDDMREVLGKVDTLMDALPAIVAAAEHALATVDELLVDVRTAASHAPELARKVDVSLDETSRLVEAVQRNVLLRGTLPERPTLRTQTDVRPGSVGADAGAR